MAEEKKTNYFVGAGKIVAYVFVTVVSSNALYNLIAAMPWVQGLSEEIKGALMILINVILWAIVKYITDKGWVDSALVSIKDFYKTNFPGVDPEKGDTNV